MKLFNILLIGILNIYFVLSEGILNKTLYCYQIILYKKINKNY